MPHLWHMLPPFRHMLPPFRCSRPVFRPEKQPLNDPLIGSGCSGFDAICRFLIIAHSRNFRNAGDGRAAHGDCSQRLLTGGSKTHVPMPAHRLLMAAAHGRLMVTDGDGHGQYTDGSWRLL